MEEFIIGAAAGASITGFVHWWRTPDWMGPWWYEAPKPPYGCGKKSKDYAKAWQTILPNIIHIYTCKVCRAAAPQRREFERGARV